MNSKYLNQSFAFLILGLILFPACKEAPDKEEESLAESGVVEISIEVQKNAELKLEEPLRQKLESTVTATGIVSPDQTRYAKISPLGRGVIEEVYDRAIREHNKGVIPL